MQFLNRRGMALFLACGVAVAIVIAIFAGLLRPIFGMLSIALILLTLFWSIREHLPSILLVFFGVLFAGVVVTNRPPKLRADRMEAKEGEALSQKWMSSGAFNEKLPIVMHLIFDEMMSTGAMTNDLPQGAATRQLLLDFGQRHSFRVFDSVYSRFFFSGVSMPNMMNAEYLGRDALSEVELVQHGDRSQNAYFDDMAARGYRTVVFQTALMNFCMNKNVDLCETFDSFDPGGKNDVILDPVNQRASLWQTVARSYQPSYTSIAGQALLGRYYGVRAREFGVPGTGERYDAPRFPAWFDRFKQFAVTVPRGTHVFAHFMVPHSPYLLSERCVVGGEFEVGYYLAKYPANERAQRRSRYYDRYFSQLGCVERKLDELMTAIDGLENFRDAVIIIHGDHGSRISNGNLFEDLETRDFIDNYAAFFAVRSPAAKPGLDCEEISLPEVFRRYAARPGTAVTSDGPLSLLVRRRDPPDMRVQLPMPPFGCAQQTLTQ